ncbi:MAG: hypothetical protein LBI82_11710 [Dysgonamonadaceae bacterium]|jgi:hypothetical protein|nr:hypothetical protein [Dysgonamonadaceae bacterium]
MTTIKKKTTRPKVRATAASVKSKIKPRGLAGWMKGKIHYDEDADIFNLEPLPQ